jgi:hypothetical protein
MHYLMPIIMLFLNLFSVLYEYTEYTVVLIDNNPAFLYSSCLNINQVSTLRSAGLGIQYFFENLNNYIFQTNVVKPNLCGSPNSVYVAFQKPILNIVDFFGKATDSKIM